MNGRAEPAVTVAGITAAVTAVLAVLAAFGLPLTDEQQTAILGLVAVVGPLVVGFVVRRFVTPSKHVLAQTNSSGEAIAGDGSDMTTGTPVSIDAEPQHAAGDDEDLPGAEPSP